MKKILLIILTGLFFALSLVGIGQDLPYAPHIDEIHFITSAHRIARTGNLNPFWFGNPGSTVIYPLAFLMKLGDFLDLRLAAGWQNQYLLGRAVSVGYAVLSLPLLYLLAKRLFGAETRALIAVSLYVFYPLVIRHSQLTRTDSAATFWGLFALNLFAVMIKSPTIKNYLLTALAVGLAISSRYFMVALIPLFFIYPFLDKIRRGNPAGYAWRRSLFGASAAVLSFVVTTPYFLLDFQRVLISLNIEARSIHPGADGLTKAGNLIWYISEALPDAITSLQFAFLVIGALLILVRKDRTLIAVLYSVIFFLIISAHPLHWRRWLIPLLPIVSLIVAHGYVTIVQLVTKNAFVLSLGVAMLLYLPVTSTIRTTLYNARPTTRVRATRWVLKNVPAGSRIATEVYTGGLVTENFYHYGEFLPEFTLNGYTVLQTDTLADEPLEFYLSQGYRYFMINASRQRSRQTENSNVLDNSTHQSLQQQGRLLKTVSSAGRRGDDIAIYLAPGINLDAKE